jgi:outer membrane receptor protein involved in Fe transport
MNKTSKTTIAAVVAQYLLISPQIAYTQVLEEVLVTARKRTESLTDAPVAVSVVDGETLIREGITNLEQLSSQVPGLQLGRTTFTSSIYIRGIGSAMNAGFEQSAGMYVDGIYQPRSRQFTLSLVDLNRIEVLRGPQSLLFGKNTVAGAIKVETADPFPGEDFNGYLLADIEPEYGTARGTAVFSGGLTDTFAARLALRYQETDGYVDNVYIDKEVQQRDDTIGRLSLVWEPTESLRVVGKIAHTEMDGKGTEQVNAVANSDLLDETLAGNTEPIVTNVLGAIAAFNTPGFTAATGSKEYESWTGNLDWAPYDEEKTEANQASLRLDWQLDQLTITSLTGYTDFEFKQSLDVDFHPGNVAHGGGGEETDSFSQEFRISSNYGGFFNFTAGVYYEDQNVNMAYQNNIDGTMGGTLGQIPANTLNPALPPIPLSALGINSLWNGTVLSLLDPAAAALIGAEQDVLMDRYSFDSENDSTAVFLELSFDLSDSLALDIGGRWSEDTKESLKKVAVGVGAPSDGVIVIDNNGVPTGALDAQNTALVGISWGLLSTYPSNQKLEREESHFDPSVRLRWDASYDTMVYLSYVEGYKSGGFNPTADTSNPDGSPAEGTEFEDENAEAWELGIKSSYWDNRARLSATLFHTQVDDLQVTSFRGTSFTVSNAASITSQGVELEAQYALSGQWELGGSLAYLDSEFDDYENAPCTIYQVAQEGATCFQDLSGERGPNAPEWSGLIYAAYEQTVWKDLLLRFNISGAFKDEYFLDVDLDENTLQDSYVKLNASLAIASGENHWEVSLYGRNLTDETTYTYATDAPLSAGIYAHWIEEPRIIGLQGRYNF